MTDLAYSDPITREFWSAALEGVLLLQSCARCSSVQFYPRPFCLKCEGRVLAWKRSSGRGRLYSATTVRIPVVAAHKPPYRLGLVELIEGPRLLGHLANEEIRIGDLVMLTWAKVHGVDQPLPIFDLDDRPGETDSASKVKEPRD